MVPFSLKNFTEGREGHEGQPLFSTTPLADTSAETLRPL